MRGTLNAGVQGAMLALMQVAMIGASLWLWARGQASVGDITFALTMFFMLQGYLREVGTDIRNLQRSINDMEELVTLERQPLGVADKPGAGAIRITEGEIRFDDVTFRYGAHDTPLYEHFGAHRAGRARRAGGPFGFGQDHVHQADPAPVRRQRRPHPDRRTGHRPGAAGPLRRQIAIVQQEPILFHRTLAENIAYGRPGATQAEIEHAARQASAHDFIMRLPKGYDTMVGERGVKLSGGERQRVAIARAFLADAPILILDEATSSLDSESEVLIQQAMERLMEGRSTLVVAHRLSTVRALDRLLVMDHGRVIEEGNHETLIRRPGGVYRRLFERQALELTKGMSLEELRGDASRFVDEPEDSDLALDPR